ncbi:hypothetical protein PBY51_018241 [Eleginops maclovinus]|uniref:Uncharacterized protein n=1 Tax=Eleginops maclovinus TaxID=56733 RepID=A0AAN7XLU1_ELEMC|nr:hypothetical protein PBY51_018241 [Eleginops maclovinus]
MEDGDLAKYISSFGDRLALKSFCRNGTTQKTKMGLFEKLRVKLKKRNNAEENENRKTKQARKAEENKTQDAEPADSSAGSSNKRRKATHRKIEIGWLHCEGEQRKQIRGKQGGGTRMVPIGIECGMDEVLQKGKRLLFPDVLSSKGHESEFNFELRDYKQNPVHEDATVGFIYDTLCMARLRFYVATSPKELKDDSATDGEKSKCGVITIDEDEEDDHQDSHDASQQDDLQCDSEQNKSERVQEEEDGVTITGIRYGTLFECDLVTDIESEVTFGPGCREIETDADDDTEPFDFGFQPQLQLQPLITSDVSSSLHSASSLQQVMDPPPEQLLSTSTVSNDASPAQLPGSTSQASLAKIITIHHVDPSELMEVLENYECRKMIKAKMLPQILKEIAHKELVQKPRRPIGHTCAFVLEVSDSYDNFPDFRSEFNAVLDSNIWVMDIV